ncbi:MAG: hypothetical protein LBQ79_14935 [Deltaproteobacteria bacterium]|jgi:hypothetical protein|nr:hypothetical protein [Deltaproteobacteria bacterium]
MAAPEAGGAAVPAVREEAEEEVPTETEPIWAGSAAEAARVLTEATAGRAEQQEEA